MTGERIDFSETCKIGDKVFDDVFMEWGIIRQINNLELAAYALLVQFDIAIGTTCYTADGRHSINDKRPRLLLKCPDWLPDEVTVQC